MQISINNIGAIIAYVIPGLVAIVGISYFSATIQEFLKSPTEKGPTFGGAVLLILAALGAGLVSDKIRSITLDELNFLTGVKRCYWVYSDLTPERLAQFEGITDNFLRYAQFYGNLFICLSFAYVARQKALKKWPWPLSWREVGFVSLLLVTWWGGRSELSQCWQSTCELFAHKLR